MWKHGRWKKSSLNWQVSFGEGIGRYVHSFTGTGSDAVVDVNGDMQILPVQSYVVGYQYFWTPTLRSGVVLALARLENQPAQPDDAIQETRSPKLNLIWSPWQLIDIMGEIMWGERTNKDGMTGTATRLQLAVKFRFP